jgi:hypothetical protein
LGIAFGLNLGLFEAWYGYYVEDYNDCIYMKVAWGGVVWETGVYNDRYCRHS